MIACSAPLPVGESPCLTQVSRTHRPQQPRQSPGVNELAAGFARASGHKVTVLNEAGSALEQRLANGPADLIMGDPDAIEAWPRRAGSSPAA